MKLSSVIKLFEADFYQQYATKSLLGHRHALSVLKDCRSEYSPKMKLECSDCNNIDYLPHSCGHRHCPHCQKHESLAWIDNQLKKQVKGNYVLTTFTIPAEFRSLFFSHQRQLSAKHPEKWVVDCKAVGQGNKAIVYLGRYLYRGVIREKDILSVKDGKVTFCYQDANTKKRETRTISGAKFLWLIIQHVLPKGFRRSRNYGFLHPNSKLLEQIQLVTQVLIKPPKTKERTTMNCPCCGGEMKVVQTRIKNTRQRWRQIPDLKPQGATQ